MADEVKAIVPLKKKDNENWSQAIRRWHFEEKISTADISKRTGKRYQQVRNVVVTEEQRRKAEAYDREQEAKNKTAETAGK